MDIFNAGLQPFFDKRLDRREVELRQLIDSTNELSHEADAGAQRRVVDFKNAADEQALATIDEAAVPGATRHPSGVTSSVVHCIPG